MRWAPNDCVTAYIMHGRQEVVNHFAYSTPSVAIYICGDRRKIYVTYYSKIFDFGAVKFHVQTKLAKNKRKYFYEISFISRSYKRNS